MLVGGFISHAAISDQADWGHSCQLLVVWPLVESAWHAKFGRWLPEQVQGKLFSLVLPLVGSTAAKLQGFCGAEMDIIIARPVHLPL
mmetsp:Transcript_119496/g.266728  ORF Transcript_119496/g.266728 Transcript_119496/m.266728 type:complete len:87 (+) Transcript_119496:37-297(+)